MDISRFVSGVGEFLSQNLAQLDQLQAIFGIFPIILKVKPRVSIAAL